MAKNIIGIDISDFSIEAVALEKEKSGFKIESYSRFRLSPEIVEDGKILNREKLKEAILKMLQNAKPLALDKSHKVFLSIPESQTFSKVLSLPKGIKDKELEKVTLNKAEEIIPEDVANLTSVVKILSPTTHHKKVFYTAVKTDVLKDFVSIFEEIGIEVAGVTTEAISSFEGVKKEKNNKNTLFLDLGARTTIASIFTKDGLSASINIDIGGDNITKALVEKLKISYEKAEEKKVQIGLNSDESGETMLVSQGQLQPLVDELKIFIKYWQDSNDKLIDHIILVGGLSQMKGANKYFGDNLSLPTELGQAFIDSKDLPKDLKVSKYINALGLAKLAHQGTDINFYRKLSKEDRKQDGKLNVLSSKKNLFKNIFKNTYFWVTLAILILSAGAFLFYNKINSNNTIAEEVIEKQIFVTLENPDAKENFIAGEYYDIDFTKAFIPNDKLEYDKAIDAAISQANEDIIPLLNTFYNKEGYYIIPKVTSLEISDLSPEEDKYVAGENLEIIVKYEFMMFSEDSIKTYLISKYPELEGKINSLEYGLVDYKSDGENNSFNIAVFIHKKIE